MSKLILRGLFFGVIFLACAVLASASSINSASAPSISAPAPPLIADINLYGYCGGLDPCTYFLGMEGSSASGYAAFSYNSLGTGFFNWTFETAPALSWSDEGGNGYEASFGYGGSFQIFLPNGLNFNGVVTSGGDSTMGTLSEINVTFFGQWSNGQYAYGSTQLMQTPYGIVAQFSEQPAPEPSSIALFATGVAGVWGWRRKFMR